MIGLDDGDLFPRTATAEIATPAGLIRLESTSQVVTWEDGPDENWKHTDLHGHTHIYEPEAIRDDYGGLTRKHSRRKIRHHWSHYPTLIWVVDRQHKCWGNEGLYSHEPHWVEEGRWRCRRCWVVVEPGHGPGSKTIPVSRSATLTEERADPPSGWLDGYEGRVTWKGGMALGTRTIHLPWEDAMALVESQLAADRQREADAEARRIMRQLGYPPGFGQEDL